MVARWKRSIASVLASYPFRQILGSVSKSPGGRRFLNRIAGTSGVYDSVDDARAVILRTRLAGHNHESLSDLHLRLGLRLSDYPVLFWLQKTKARLIFDFGGSVGNLYYAYKEHLAPQCFMWRVYDLPEVVDRGRRLAASQGASDLQFTADLAEARHSDVFLSSGSLHYWEGSIGDLLAGLQAQPEHVIINRCPLSEDLGPYWIIDRGPSTAFPSLIRNRNALIEEFLRRGYELADQWFDRGRSRQKLLFPHHSITAYSGLYFRRK
jgi:putative methyltransferase (TIGR04325 family)